jgi:hypothetical protein
VHGVTLNLNRKAADGGKHHAGTKVIGILSKYQFKWKGLQSSSTIPE